jgi:hypothetical protein
MATITTFYIHKVSFRPANIEIVLLIDRSKMGTRRHILTDKNSILLFVIISPFPLLRILYG